MSKETVSRIISIVLTAAIALAAAFGYSILVVQPGVNALRAEVARLQVQTQGLSGAPRPSTFDSTPPQ